MKVLIRPAEKTDMKTVLSLIQELADYEKAPNEVINTEEALIEDGFGEKKVFDCQVAEIDGQVIGFMLIYTSYSTWKGKCVYLEDFYIKEEFRRYGVGQKLWKWLIQECEKRKIKRLEWQVLEWNQPAISFYEKVGATIDKEWYNGRVFF